MINENEAVNSPPHYLEGGIECIDYIRAKMTKDECIGYLKGCIFKYLSRANFKGNHVQDCKKAQWYMNKLVEVLDK